MNYYDKYLKYKNKYLHFKLQQFGGDKPYIKNIDNINLFSDQLMEQYLNPIYGMILCYSGFIPNNYFLLESKFIEKTSESILIKKICTVIPRIHDSIRPTSDIINNIKQIDIGRFIAIKFINMIMNNKLFYINSSGKIKFLPEFNITDRKILTNYIEKFNRYNPILNNEIFYFHIILYCLWWVANNDEGIEQYYNGINEVFCIINKYFLLQNKYLDVNNVSKKTDSFEKIIFKITYEPFIIYNQEKALNFCIPNSVDKYADCGEVTARNLINLICFVDDKFNISILEKFKAIQQVKDYYKIFDDFKKQSDNNNLETIYNEKLNSRDAWSKLIINFGNSNINFVKSCNSNKYELNAGLSLDKKISNFLQLIKNLLPGITNWNDIKNDLINDVQDQTTDGIGDIIINHIKYKNIIIHCMSGHYYMEVKKSNDQNLINYDHLNENQQSIIKRLLKEPSYISIDNYMLINFDSNLLVEIFNTTTDKELKIKLFELSLTKKYDSDTRRRIELDVNDLDFFNNIICKYKNNILFDEYTYISNDFNFVKIEENSIQFDKT